MGEHMVGELVYQIQVS